MEKKTNKRISFDEYSAVHIYEYLRFYWEDAFLKDPDFRKSVNKFGSCPECEQIGKRLEAFVGKKEIQFVEKLLKKHRKIYDK